MLAQRHGEPFGPVLQVRQDGGLSKGGVRHEDDARQFGLGDIGRPAHEGLEEARAPVLAIEIQRSLQGKELYRP